MYFRNTMISVPSALLFISIYIATCTFIILGGFVLGHRFVMQYFVSFLFSQATRRGRKRWLLLRWSRKFCQRRSNFFVDEEKNDPNTTITGPWWPNIECWLDSFVIFRGSGPVSLGNPIFLWFCIVPKFFFNTFMPTCSDFLLYLPFKTLAFDQICTLCWLPDDGSTILDKQVTNNIILEGGVGLGYLLLYMLYLYTGN